MLLSFQLNSIQRPPSCEEKTARTFCDSSTHSGDPSPSRSALQATVRPRGSSSTRMGRSSVAPPATFKCQSRRPGQAVLGEDAQRVAALIHGADADLGFRREEVQAFARGFQAVGLNAGPVVAERHFQIACRPLGSIGDDRRIGRQLGVLPEVDLHGFHQADGGGRNSCRRARPSSTPSASSARLAQSPWTRVGRDRHFVVDLVGRFRCRRGGEAFGQPQARARGHIRRRVGGGDAVLLADDQPPRFVEEGRGFGLLDGDADAHAVVGAGAWREW